VYATSIHLLPSLIFESKAGAYRSKSLKGLNSNGKRLALPTNIRPGWEYMKVANTQAYYERATITAVKCFIVQAPV
jgi:hypothetical protein